jgi:hypothetical protein
MTFALALLVALAWLGMAIPGLFRSFFFISHVHSLVLLIVVSVLEKCAHHQPFAFTLLFQQQRTPRRNAPLHYVVMQQVVVGVRTLSFHACPRPIPLFSSCYIFTFLNTQYRRRRLFQLW